MNTFSRLSPVLQTEDDGWGQMARMKAEGTIGWVGVVLCAALDLGVSPWCILWTRGHIYGEERGNMEFECFHQVS